MKKSAIKTLSPRQQRLAERAARVAARNAGKPATADATKRGKGKVRVATKAGRAAKRPTVMIVGTRPTDLSKKVDAYQRAELRRLKKAARVATRHERKVVAAGRKVIQASWKALTAMEKSETFADDYAIYKAGVRAHNKLAGEWARGRMGKACDAAHSDAYKSEAFKGVHVAASDFELVIGEWELALEGIV